MTSPDPIVLCTYRYDPLDRLASSSPVGQTDVQRFYQKNRLATEIEGASRRTVFQHEDLLLAQQRHVDGVVDTTLLATDQQRSVLRLVDKSGIEPVAYSAYGHHPAESGLTSLLGFNGERRDPVTGHYLLGNGYRAYNPVLMRFNSPDSLSPFDEGGLNAYGYCGGDPVGFVDETGHISASMLNKIILKGLIKVKPRRTVADFATTASASASASAGAGAGASASASAIVSPVTNISRAGDTTVSSLVSRNATSLPSTSLSASTSRAKPVWVRKKTGLSWEVKKAQERLRYKPKTNLPKTGLPNSEVAANARLEALNRRMDDAKYLIAHFKKNKGKLKHSRDPVESSVTKYQGEYASAVTQRDKYLKEYNKYYNAPIRNPDYNQ
ncbi:RHS repeat-associated core domain-containing protein [Pseudomonas syringae]|uniref:RHS repeat-associated core domain-containing protein n=1 Tax=Pseudomonas syringae TaxID=317 RepID=UPI0023FA4573|nr:RHS repeat-associated core domain-containing protein [Pseudomonas syringae]MDF7796518.1 RHS repeat-associated core domain-containing protein [Pseudomonas syringae]